jgi:hypothetical protein
MATRTYVTGSKLNDSKWWESDRDSYGRSIHYLVHATDKNRTTLGVVIKHPFIKPGQPGAYWYAKWGYTTLDDVVVRFTRLRDAKAGLLEATS